MQDPVVGMDRTGPFTSVLYRVLSSTAIGKLRSLPGHQLSRPPPGQGSWLGCLRVVRQEPDLDVEGESTGVGGSQWLAFT